MKTVTSKDCTTLAFDRSGQGPALHGQTHEVSAEVLAPRLIKFFERRADIKSDLNIFWRLM